MAIPKEIRDVPRPSNTVVVENRTEGPKRYAVRARLGTKYVPHGNPQPINGEVIGYIYGGKFHPRCDDPGNEGPDSRSYGAAALAKSVSEDIKNDLISVMGIDYAVETYVAAVIKTIKPAVKSKRMSTEYRRTFVGVWDPDLPINANKMTDLYRRIGMDGKVRAAYAEARLKHLNVTNHIVIDGMLKQDNSSVNDLSGYSHKTRTKGVKDISIIYAYDLENKEILCSEVFPGGCIDASAYPRFVRDNHITKGILVNDKGFPPSKLEEELKSSPDLHFLTPLKRNDSRISSNNMLDFDDFLRKAEGEIYCKKAELRGGRYLYSFKDQSLAAKEDRAYLGKIRSKNLPFNKEDHGKRSRNFGTVVFLSDLDLTCEQAYDIYACRGEIELVFKVFKNDTEIDSTDSQDDFTVIGEEFVNTVASTITCRMLKEIEKTGLLKTMSYGDVIEDLSTLWRRTDAPKDVLPDRSDRYWIHPFEYALDELILLGLCNGKVRTALGKKKMDSDDAQKGDDGCEEIQKPRRGRPRKNPAVPDAPKRPRGRPRKNPQ